MHPNESTMLKAARPLPTYSSSVNCQQIVRVAHVVGQLRMGGMEKLLLEFAKHADRSRFELRFVSLEDRGSLASDLEALGWPVTTLQIPAGIRASAVVALYRMFRKWRINVVHSHNTRPLFYAGLAARLARVRRVIHTRHGQEFQVDWTQRLAFNAAARLADVVVCVSHDSAAGAASQGISKHRLRTLWNGIDHEQFPAADPSGNGPIIAVGRLSPEKDFATMLKAAALAVRTVPEFQLWIAGDGICRVQLEKSIHELGLHGTVKLLGEVRNIPALLSQGRAFAMSSLTEGISLTLLEAMSAGLPIVATSVGGNTEVVEDGCTGVLVPAANPERLAIALVALWTDSRERGRLGRAGRDRVVKHFSARKMVAAYERMYYGDAAAVSAKSELY